MAAPESGDGNDGATTMVTLISSDNRRFEVHKAAASLSPTVHRMMAEGGGGRRDVIPLPNIDGVTLFKVVEYCVKHAPAAAAAENREELERFDVEFVNIDQSMLCSIIVAAHYLEIERIQQLVGQKIADMIKGKSVEQIRRTFNVPVPTPEEQATINAQLQAEMQPNHWAFE